MGVVSGDDITVPSARASKDKSLHGLKAFAKLDPDRAAAEADPIIKNTYRTLMTRGMKGCFIYCTDDETREYFQRCLP
jgi:uncharacterized protein